MRTGEDPGAVFDALVARGQVRLHADPADLQQGLAAVAAAHHYEGGRLAVVVDTREQAAELSAAFRVRLVGDGCVDDRAAVTTRAGQRIGAGDQVVTRRNDGDIGVANRDVWTVAAVGRHGELAVIPAAVTPTNAVRAGVTPATARQWVLPSGYVTSHVELAYASTAHGVQGDTVTAAHVVIGEHTGAASAYVGMTRGRTANIAHLVAEDLAQAREQWIAVFGRDRADLGPGHAAELAAAQAASYAAPRPLEQVLAELHQAWTAEQRCLDRLALWQPMRDRLREIVALHAGHADELAALEARCRMTSLAAARASQRAEVRGTAVTEEAARMRDDLLGRWDRDRDAARAAARVVLDGPGRLRLRRAAVTHASGDLTDWADRWRPQLPTLPADPGRLAQYADRSDDRPALAIAFSAAARRAAEHAHPEHAVLHAAADTARQAHERARGALAEAGRRHDDELSRFGALGRTPDPADGLAYAERDIAVATEELTAVRARLGRLATEPALLRQPADVLVRERDIWHVGQGADGVPRRPAGLQPRPGIHVPPPEHERQPARRPGVQPGLGR